MSLKIKIRLTLLHSLAFLFTVTGLSYSRRRCRAYAASMKSAPCELAVIPGIPLSNGRWNMIMKARVLWAKYIIENGLARYVMFSGAAVHTPYVESEVMAVYARACGVPDDRILTETEAEHSTENIYLSYIKAVEMGFRDIALASDPFQTRLLSRFVRRKVSPDIRKLPVVYDYIAVLDAATPDPQIDFSSLRVENFVPLKKRHGLRRRFRGTRGLHLDRQSPKPSY